MTLEPGRMLLQYRLVEKIGEGGMGVVWKAVDTSLDRPVAIKILPDRFADDADRLARFEREAKLLASLSHPGIAVIHGLHRAEDGRFLAMELVPGEDLARRLRRGALPTDDALRIALRLAEALEAAHENGVIHRDLKPANLQLGPDGTIKVLDFGLAKALEPVSSSDVDPAMSPTMTSAGTLAGVILGTAAYMSPEQAKGAPADRRADIWAFGCVLLEMLGGRRPFTGESIAETLASVIKEEPDWSSLPGTVPVEVRRLLRRCLVKDPRRRLRDIGEARIVLADVLSGKVEPSAVATPDRARSRRLPWLLCGLLGVAWIASMILLGSGHGGPEPGERPLRLSIVLPAKRAMIMANLDSEMMGPLALAPTGNRLVYTAIDAPGEAVGGRPLRHLSLRDFADFGDRPLRGTDDAEMPFFSPDGRWIGFFDGGSLRKITESGGASVEIVAEIGNGNGASWGRDGTIVFAHSYVGPLWRVSENGGTPQPLTRLAENERSHRFPHVTPDGRWVLFTVKPSGILDFSDGWIAIADLATGEHRVLLEGGADARYVASGYLVYARDGGLLAAPFDLARGELTGGAVPVLDGLITNPVTGSAMMAISEDGALAFVPGSFGKGPARLFAFDRETGERRPLASRAMAVAPRLSPDGRRLVLHGPSANDQVLVLDIARDTLTRLTDTTTNNILPIWGPRGRRIYFTTDRSGSEELVSMPAEGGPVESLAPPVGPPQEAYDWSHDGRRLTINVGVRSSRDIWVLDATEGGEPEAFVATPFDEGNAVFSPDGRWIAYSSDESGRLEVYVRRYPGSGGKYQMSTGGGEFPRWRADGGELYYQSGSTLVAVPVAWHPEPTAGPATELIRLASPVALGFDVSRDGRTFYVCELDESSWLATRVDVVLDWVESLKRSPD